MRDLHSHFLPGVDDGARSIDSTKRLLYSAKENGITDVMFTPHYIVDSDYTSSREENLEIFEGIKEIAYNFGINVYLGNEVYCDNDMLELYKNGKISTLNDSRYMLIEIPMYSKMNNVKSIFFELISNGIIPILAHPERYTAYLDDIDFFIELVEMGVLLQMNYPSLVGTYGSKPKKMVKQLLKLNLITFAGSDIHSASEGKYDMLPKAMKKLKRLVGEEEAEKIMNTNFLKVIRDEEI